MAELFLFLSLKVNSIANFDTGLHSGFTSNKAVYSNSAYKMKNSYFFLLLLFMLTAGSFSASAQCSVCTRTAQQLGDKPAKTLNAGILYLAAAPLIIIGVVGYRWWRRNGE